MYKIWHGSSLKTLKGKFIFIFAEPSIYIQQRISQNCYVKHNTKAVLVPRHPTSPYQRNPLFEVNKNSDIKCFIVASSFHCGKMLVAKRPRDTFSTTLTLKYYCHISFNYWCSILLCLRETRCIKIFNFTFKTDCFYIKRIQVFLSSLHHKSRKGTTKK